jgi:hypothetical protein
MLPENPEVVHKCGKIIRLIVWRRSIGVGANRYWRAGATDKLYPAVAISEVKLKWVFHDATVSSKSDE